jgi:hypothetical protein
VALTKAEQVLTGLHESAQMYRTVNGVRLERVSRDAWRDPRNGSVYIWIPGLPARAIGNWMRADVNTRSSTLSELVS